MSGIIKRHEKLALVLRRIGRREVRVMLKCGSRADQPDFAKSVHQARKSIKRLRALLRLIRPCLDEEQYRSQMKELREMAHELSPVRDTAVQLQTWHKFQRMFRRHLSVPEFSRVCQAAARHNMAQLAKLAGFGNAWTSRCQSLLAAIGEWKLKGCRWPNLRPRLKRSWKRFARDYDQARQTPTMARLHEWRKRTKVLAGQLDFLQRLRPKSAQRCLSRLNDLGEILGDDHDLALLEKVADETDPRVADGIRHVTQARRARLQGAAFKLGHKLRGRRRW